MYCFGTQINAEYADFFNLKICVHPRLSASNLPLMKNYQELGSNPKMLLAFSISRRVSFPWIFFRQVLTSG